MPASSAGTPYRIIQLGAPSPPLGLQKNEPVSGFGSLVTHHPGANRNARMEDGVVIQGERNRVHAYIGGRLEEIATAAPTPWRGGDRELSGDRILLKKDFILEHPDRSNTSSSARLVDVPSPVHGYVGMRHDRQGLVELLDRPGGDVVVRIRHMRDISVTTGESVRYGQSLGVQGAMGSGAVHVHIEMDTRYYGQFRNYVDDLASGRLPVEAEHREGVLPRPVAHDGSFRLGEADARIGDLQRVMTVEGYRSAGGAPLDQDGVYRPRMQGALLDFQRDHGLPQSGDIDAATLRFAPPPPRREVDRHDHAGAHGFPPREAAPPTAPGHPDHPDHRPLPAEPEPPRNGRPASAVLFEDPLLRSFAAALESGDRDVVSRACDDLARSPRMQAFLAQGREALQAFEAQQAEAPARDAEVAALARG